jgi:hypothetical protein
VIARASVAVAIAALLVACGGDGGDDMPATGRPRRDDSRDPAALSACYGAPRDAASPGPLRFADATTDLGLEQPLTGMMAHAVATGDVNADGWVDLFVGTFADRPAESYQTRGASGPSSDALLLGGPAGFRRDPDFPGERGRTSGAAFADLDGDDEIQIVVARNHRDKPGGAAPTVVIENDGGRLRGIHELDRTRGLRSVGVLDYDGDGALDLFLVEDRFSDGSSVLLRNEGGLQFTDVTEAAGLPSHIDGLGVAAADLNDDGRQDLFVAGSNRLFVNRGGHFDEVVNREFEWTTYGSEDDPAGVAVGDLNRDGRLDLVIGQHFNSTLDEGRSVPVRLYVNDGNDDEGGPRYRDVSEAAGLVGLPTKAPHVEVVDFDRDGWPDILTGASAGDGARPAIFRGVGSDGGIPQFEAPAGLGDEQYWVTGATFDADRDGSLDVFLAEFEPALPSRFLRNEAVAGHWLDVQLGPAGTNGVGARVDVFEAGSAGAPEARLGSGEITAATGYGSGAYPAARFGLGSIAEVDIVIRRAGDTERATIANVDADQLLSVDATSSC